MIIDSRLTASVDEMYYYIIAYDEHRKTELILTRAGKFYAPANCIVGGAEAGDISARLFTSILDAKEWLFNRLRDKNAEFAKYNKFFVQSITPIDIRRVKNERQVTSIPN